MGLNNNKEQFKKNNHKHVEEDKKKVKMKESIIIQKERIECLCSSSELKHILIINIDLINYYTFNIYQVKLVNEKVNDNKIEFKHSEIDIIFNSKPKIILQIY